MSCGYRRWDLCGILRKHALSVITYERLQVEKYVHISEHVDMYLMAYELPIYSINSIEEWKNMVLPILESPLLVDVILHGRPMVNQRLQVDEPLAKHKKRRDKPCVNESTWRFKREQSIVQCSKRKQTSHNRTCCKNPPNVVMDLTHVSSLTLFVLQSYYYSIQLGKLI